jgi:hypothetical protein
VHMFDKLRPEVVPGSPALLLDGSAIPHILTIPTSDGQILLAAMLNNYDVHGGYSWHHCKLFPQDLEKFFRDYAKDPEAVLANFFAWTDYPNRPQRKLSSPPISVAAARAATPGLDLLDD